MPGPVHDNFGVPNGCNAHHLMAEDHAYFSGALELVLGPRLYGGCLRPIIFHHATTVMEARKLVAEAGPFDPAVVDLMFPDGDGTDVVRAMKERWSETPVCVLISVPDLSAALAVGADEAIPKSIPLLEMVGVLARPAQGEEKPAT